VRGEVGRTSAKILGLHGRSFYLLLNTTFFH